mmetsp:Transcript_6910/g.28298  ORF Transcript_6910/g.28298 Transcript_6910/m.28298 type:complete len:214 (+) Transcript_6910:937-1578(+)
MPTAACGSSTTMSEWAIIGTPGPLLGSTRTRAPRRGAPAPAFLGGTRTCPPASFHRSTSHQPRSRRARPCGALRMRLGARHGSVHARRQRRTRRSPRRPRPSRPRRTSAASAARRSDATHGGADEARRAVQETAAAPRHGRHPSPLGWRRWKSRRRPTKSEDPHRSWSACSTGRPARAVPVAAAPALLAIPVVPARIRRASTRDARSSLQPSV